MILAAKLGPHSISLRATYWMLDRMARDGVRGRDGKVEPVPLWRLHEHLDSACRTAMERLGVDGDGVFIDQHTEPAQPSRPVETLDDAREWMRRPGFCKSLKFRELQASVGRAGAYRKLIRWERAVVRSLAARHIPVFARSFVRASHVQDACFVRGETDLRAHDAPHVHGFAVDLVHVDLGVSMPPLCWHVIHHVGQVYANRYRLPLLRPTAEKPWHWEVHDWPALRCERTGPAGDLSDEHLGGRWVNTSRSPPGEREWLMEYYGIKPEVEPYRQQPEIEGDEGEAPA